MGTTRVQGTDPKQDRHPHSWGARRLQKKKAWDWSREGRWNVLGPDVGGRGSERDRPGSSPYLTCKGRRKDPEDAYLQVRSLPWPCPTHTPPLEAGILLLSTPQDPRTRPQAAVFTALPFSKARGADRKTRSMVGSMSCSSPRMLPCPVSTALRRGGVSSHIPTPSMARSRCSTNVWLSKWTNRWSSRRSRGTAGCPFLMSCRRGDGGSEKLKGVPGTKKSLSGHQTPGLTCYTLHHHRAEHAVEVS